MHVRKLARVVLLAASIQYPVLSHPRIVSLVGLQLLNPLTHALEFLKNLGIRIVRRGNKIWGGEAVTVIGPGTRSFLFLSASLRKSLWWI